MTDPFAILLRQLAHERQFIRTHQVIADAIVAHLVRLDRPRFERTFALKDGAIPSPN